jgi:hypothetical protein
MNSSQLDNRDLIPVGVRMCLFQITSKTYSRPYTSSSVLEAISRGVKQWQREADYSATCNDKVKYPHTLSQLQYAICTQA